MAEQERADRNTAPAPDAGAIPPADPAALPEPVRSRLAELAAAALGAMPAADVPRSLRAVARFAPAKRAKVGGAALLAELATPAFHSWVVRWCSEQRPDALVTVAEAGRPQPDATAAAAAAVLTGSPVAAALVELVDRRQHDAALRDQRDAAAARERKLREQLAQVRAMDGREGGDGDEIERLRAEVSKLRKRLREQGVRLREARDAAEAASAAAAAARSDAELEVKAALAERDRERERADAERVRARRALAEVDTARQSAREARDADEVRLGLLLQTLEGAAAGLRRELAVAPRRQDGPRPADMVVGARTSRAPAGRTDDPAAVDRLLALPAVHVIVDGYNVTKTGYPELPLADQRSRLVHQLGALAARTGAEVTLVFDGAGVTVPPPTAPRGVRVLFSDPGVLADDVIRSLVAAEPRGRAMVVVTSDREVVDSVRVFGAHPVPSAVLLRLLARV